MALHVQFAQTALGVQRRYYRLNLAIRNIFALSKIGFVIIPISKNNFTKNHVSCIEKLAETASNLEKNRHAKEATMASKAAGTTTTTTAEATATTIPGAVTIIDSNNEVSLPGSNMNISANSITKATILAHATQDENHVAPTFAPGKYSASLSTAYGANF